MASPTNLYHRRLVAEKSAKACWICYKPSSTVLITPNQDDWFHICAGHLIDSKFAIAKDADDIAERKRKEEIDKEIQVVKAEFEEKMRKKMARRKQKEYEKDKDGKKKDEADTNAKTEDEKEEKEKEEKLKELEGKKDPAAMEKTMIDGPRVFELQKQFWQMRMQKKRDTEAARRMKERLKQPGAFPSVPQGGLG
ncbi:hypothetical protein LTR78_009599 [Recurvomyces mirabilis]|uniref:DUF1742-domain-containing protein n=1 Tax=Recurvomyces mirabilis TaxID=574656 RepID=A0AAE0WIE5_9PEZI|nr:hypothetical protein LTR78_009599 [Recurvomyces mirabilis]KAK5156598.1 hypothetical protein LTS14_004810 [Recurvomyces mirabilis]